MNGKRLRRVLMVVLLAACASGLAEDPESGAGEGRTPAAREQVDEGPVRNPLRLGGLRPQRPLRPAWPNAAGLIPDPLDVPGIRRWQMETAAPRSRILSMCFSPDGHFLAFVDSSCVRIHSFPDLRLVQILTGHAVRNWGQPLDWSSDGRWLATGGFDGQVRLWKPDGIPGPVFKGDGSPIAALGFSPDGSMIAAACYYGRVCVWKIDDSELVMSAGAHWLAALAWSEDGTRVAVGDVVRNVDVFGLDGARIRRLVDPVKVQAVAWSRDGKSIASAGYGSTVQVWKPDGKRRTTLQGPAGVMVNSLAFSRDGSLAAGDFSGRVCVWGSDGKPGPVMKHETSVSTVAWSPDGEWVASGDALGNVGVWRRDGTPGPRIDGHRVAMNGFRWSDNGSRLAAYGQDASGTGMLHVWRADGRPLFSKSAHPENVTDVAFSRNAKLVATVGREKAARVWDSDGREHAVLQNPKADNTSIDFGPGDRIAVGYDDGTVGFWTADGTESTRAQAHEGRVTDLAWNPNDNRLATGGEDGWLKIWPTDGTGTPASVKQPAAVNLLQWNADGNRLAVSSNGRDGWRRVQTLDQNGAAVSHPGDVAVVKFDLSRDGKRLAGSSAASGVNLWTWNAQGKALGTVDAWGFTFSGIAWSPDARRVASGGSDGAVWLFDANGTAVRPLRGHHQTVHFVNWRPNSNQVITSTGSDGVALLWNADTGRVEWATVLLPGHRLATFQANGELLGGDPKVVEKEFVFLIEKASGATELIRRGQFEAYRRKADRKPER